MRISRPFQNQPPSNQYDDKSIKTISDVLTSSSDNIDYLKLSEMQISDLVDKISWNAVCQKGNHSVNDNKIVLRFHTYTSHNKPACKLFFKIGRSIVDKLGWKAGDAICVFNDPDNYFNLMLVKNVNGYKLSKDKNAASYNLTIKWDVNMLPSDTVTVTEIKHRTVGTGQNQIAKLILPNIDRQFNENKI